MTSDLDFGDSLAAKSDQLNADDLVAGPITVRITGATVRKGADQPLALKLSGGHMPWKPCKGMRRLMAEIARSTSAEPWVGKWVQVYRDPDVQWAGAKSGGIRLAGVDASMLPRSADFRVRVSRSGYTTYRVESIRPTTEAGAPSANLDALLTDAGLTLADVDRWRASEGRGPISGLTDEQRAVFAGWLGADPKRLDAIRAAGTTSQEPPTDTRGAADGVIGGEE